MIRNRSVDVLKGIATLLVIITHYAWTNEQRLNPLFPFVINMAVPIFMVLSGYVGALMFQHHKILTIGDAYEYKEIVRKAIRYTVPYAIIVLWAIIDPNVPVGGATEGLAGRLKWLINGTMGQGSYYYPLLIQMIFVLPVIYFIIERKGKNGLWFSLIINAVYELLKWSYGMNESCYRLLIFRYIFLIAAGIYATMYKLGRILSFVMTAMGGIFVGCIIYGRYKPMTLQYWTETCYIASMWIIPTISVLIRCGRIRCGPLEIIGKASYNIFLVQMVYYLSYRGFLAEHITNWMAELAVCAIICISIGLAFYYLEQPITKKILKTVSNALPAAKIQP